MIETGFETRIKIQEVIENQLPSFVVSDYPKASEFLKQYYISQEYQGGTIDIVDNLDQYLRLDNLTPDVLSSKTKITSDITDSDSVIFVENTKGYPNQYGLFKIDNEIITYTGITTNSFTGCIRGFSGVSEYNKNGELIFETTESKFHSANSKVTNLSTLFLREFYNKIKFLLTPGLENVEFIPELNVNNFIKQAKNFYQAKGTEESFRILFNILYGETPQILDLEKFVFKPSFSEFDRRELVIVDPISGDPNNLVGQILTKMGDENTKASISEVEIIQEGLKNYYKLSLFIGYTDETDIRGNFRITPNTKIIEDVAPGSKIITVDSTVSFPKSGKLVVGNNTEITYTNKTINQFFGCVGIASTVFATSDIRTDDIYYSYENGDMSKKVLLRITGVLSKFIPITDNSLSSEGEKISVKNIGEVIKVPEFGNNKFKNIFANSWIYNTSSRYKVETITGSSPTLNIVLYSESNKSILKVGDYVDILPSSSQDILYENAFVTNINSSNTKIITLYAPGFSIISGYNYDIRRRLKKASSSNNTLLFGEEFGNNKIVADVLNVYNENDDYLYVASNSLPSYDINVSFATTSILEASELSSTIQGKDVDTGQYSTISFSENVPFITGDAIYYSPENENLIGIDTGIYYVEVLQQKNKVRLYSSKSFIPSQQFIGFNPPENDGKHTFTLLSQKDAFIGPQKLLKKIPSQTNIKNQGEYLTQSNFPIGMLCNGVEVFNYKSSDKIYYGPINEVRVLNAGNGYDIVRPPLIEISNPDFGNSKCIIEPIIEGDLREILVDPQDFDIGKVISVTISGGNNKGCLLDPVTDTIFREVSFDARESRFGGGIDLDNETITFITDHNFNNGEPIVYNNNGNVSIGIGPYKGTNLNQDETLETFGLYYAEVVNSKTIKIYNTFENYVSGINTVGFTTMFAAGTHKFVTYTGKTVLSRINILDSDKKFTYKKLYASKDQISKQNSYINIKDHGFKSGELVEYSYQGNPISGISTENRYYILNVNVDNFRLCNAGIGGTISADYERGKYVKFGNIGVGTHIFKYPDIKIDIKVTNPIGIITATPFIKGSITKTHIVRNGSGYGSKVLNFHKKPSAKIINGRNGALTAVVSGGKVIRINIQNRGSQYYSTPDIIITGNGFGAKARVIINSQGRIDRVIITQGGIGYLQGTTQVRVVPSGSNCILDPNIRSLTLNNFSRFGSNILIDKNEYVQYGYVGYSTNIGLEVFGDQKYGLSHSPIIGWAYDGCPIYGPYGFSDPQNSNSNVKILRPGYVLDSSSVIDRPNDFDDGFFIEDYKFVDNGDLDANNGKFCKTPDFPNGVYAYFAGITTCCTGPLDLYSPEFPYFIGDKFNYTPVFENFDLKLNQDFDFNNSQLIRNTLPYNVSNEYGDNDFITEPNENSSQNSVIESITKGKITSYEILQQGNGYRIGDRVVVDNEGTDGGGLSASISKISGKKIKEVITNAESYVDSRIYWKNSNTVVVNTKKTHNFNTGDNISISGISSSRLGQKLNGTYEVTIPFGQTRLSNQVPSNPFILSNSGIDLSVSSIPNNLSVGDSIRINNPNGQTEVLSVLNIFPKENVIRANRGQTINVSHPPSSLVSLIPRVLEINARAEFFNSVPNSIVYFNPVQSIGVGLSISSFNTLNYIIGNTIRQIAVPTQSIYLPNHPFKTGQKVIFRKPIDVTQILVSETQTGGSFAIPRGGNEDVLYVIKKSDNFIGLTTSVGLTTNTNGLFFASNAQNNFKYSIESQFEEISCDVDKYSTKVVLESDHSLLNGDKVDLKIIPTGSAGIGTTTFIKVKYDEEYDRILIDTVRFTNSLVNLNNNSITIINHNFSTGDKVFYKNYFSPISGIGTGDYFVYKKSRNSIQLCETYLDSLTDNPKIVQFTSSGGALHEISSINPKIEGIKGKTLNFNLSDNSLLDYKFKIFTSTDFTEEFYSERLDNTFNVTGIGTVGISTNASILLEYSDHLPEKLYYTLQKDGNIIYPDNEVVEFSQIQFNNSAYNGRFSISNIQKNSFDVTLQQYPEEFLYDSENTSTLKYSTKSKNDTGGIESIEISTGGVGYKKVPSLDRIISQQGSGASIIFKSDEIGKINSVRILNPGFEYSSDFTLRPQSFISPIITITNSDTISNIEILSGGKNYTSPPKLIIYNPIENVIPKIGFLEPIMGSGSIVKVNIVEEPKGLSPINHKIIAVNNNNGVVINEIISSESGIVTCFLATPILGFSSPPFAVGDKVFVEGIEKNHPDGTGFNSEDYQYEFFEVTEYFNTNPTQVTFTIGEGVTENAGLAKTFPTNFPVLVNYKNYPIFKSNQEKLKFFLNEKLLILSNEDYNEIDLFITESLKDYIKVFGSYDLKVNDVIKGKNSGVIAKINQLSDNTGLFLVNYSSPQSIGWKDNIGFISDDLQSIGDNDYYQNLSYTIRSSLEYQKIINPVNSLLHSSGLKNFSDMQIEESTETFDKDVSVVDSLNIIDLSNENRVDTINDFDLSIDVFSSETKSKYIKLKSRKLTDYIECRSNRVLLMDDISGQFRDRENVISLNASLLSYVIPQKYSNLIIQVRDSSSYTAKIYELVILNDSQNVFVLDKSRLANTDENIGEIEVTIDPDIDLVDVYFVPDELYSIDYDIKVIESRFNSNLTGAGNSSIGFITLTGSNSIVSSGSSTKIISNDLELFDSGFIVTQVIDNVTQHMNYFETYLSNDGTNTYTSEICFDTKLAEFSSGNYIGTFSSNLESNVLSFEYENNTSNPVTVRSKIIGFGQTSIGIGTYRFLTNGQLEETERTLKYESNYSVSIGSTDIYSVPRFDISSIKSYLRVSVGNTSALHQLLTIHNNENVYSTQYPFLSIGSDSGIGTFGSRFTLNPDLMTVSFYPDSEYENDEVKIDIFNQFIYTDVDIFNKPEQFVYGTITENQTLSFYDAPLGERLSRNNFEVTTGGIPVFAKRFNPLSSITLNKQTGVFTIQNHFFSDFEEIYYTPGSTFEGIDPYPMEIEPIENSVGIVTTLLPSILYINRIDKDRFRVSTRFDYVRSGIYVKFVDSGSGNAHVFEMAKKKEKTIVTLNGVIQSPLATTNLVYQLDNNIGGEVGFTTEFISLSGISSIFPTDVLKVNNEFMSVINVGFADSNYGPITNVGDYPLISVKRGFFGSLSTNHPDTSSIEVFSGGYDIVENKIFFVQEPKGTGIGVTIDRSTSIPFVRSSFNGRVYLRSEYSNNKIYDDISSQFTGIAQTFTLTSNGITTTGIEPGSGILVINGIFQTPTTENNVGNNYIFEEDFNAGISTVTFTGITSDNGFLITTDADVNQNQLPRGGLIVSLGSTPGLGYAPLVGASVTVVVGSSGEIVSVGLGTTDIVGSGYRGAVSIGITDPNHSGSGALITSIVGAGGSLSFVIEEPGSGYTQSSRIEISEPNYENLPVIGAFRAGIGETTETGVGLLVNVELGPFDYTPIGKFADAANLITENKTLIAEVAVGRMLNAFPGFVIPNGNQNCIDDIESVLSAIVYNLNYSGNDSVYDAAKIYIDNSYLLGEEEESIYAFEEAKSLAIQAMRNEAIDVGGYSSLTQYFDFSIEGDISEQPGVYNPGDCADVASAITQFVGIVTNAIAFSTLPNRVISPASLYQVSSFKIARSGYSFEKGDVIRVVGLVTDKNLSEPISNFELTVLDIFTDRFASWQFGELDFIDPIKNLQDGFRTRFPLFYNAELLSFEKNEEDEDSSLIDLNNVLLIFVNGVIQDPIKNYRFEGGTSVIFTTAPKREDNVSIFFYRGARDVDSVLINVPETIKDGDTVQIFKNNEIPGTVTQDPRKVSIIFSSDIVETNLYADQGVDDQRYKPLYWTKQKSDVTIDGLKIYKSRDSLEPMVFPVAKVIKSFRPSDNQIFVDDARLFNYEEDQSDIVITNIDGLVINNNNNPVAASVTAVVSEQGTIEDLIINDGGNGYNGPTVEISIANPDDLRIVGIYQTYGQGIPATSLGNISNGKITSITITNPGFGYTYTNPPSVLCPLPAPNIEFISDIPRIQGFSGIITGITTTSGTNGHPLALKFFTRSSTYQGLLVGYPIHIFDTEIGNGIVSVGQSDSSVVGVGVSFLDNIYEISSITNNGLFGEFVANIKSNSNVVGISTFGDGFDPVGRFSWGRLFNFKRNESRRISLEIDGYIVNSGLSSFPELHRRGFGLRYSGALRKDLG
jgi:hypothetical protein